MATPFICYINIKVKLLWFAVKWIDVIVVFSRSAFDTLYAA